jgi:hypothetical protein
MDEREGRERYPGVIRYRSANRNDGGNGYARVYVTKHIDHNDDDASHR